MGEPPANSDGEKRRVYRGIEPVEAADVPAILAGSDRAARIDTLISLGYYCHEREWVIATATPHIFDQDKDVSHGAALALLYLAMGDPSAKPRLHEHAQSLLVADHDIPERGREVLKELLEISTQPPWWKRWPAKLAVALRRRSQ